MLKISQLHPIHRELGTGRAIYDGLEFPVAGTKSQDTSKPYVLINMIGSVDGKAASSGVASGIGSAVDRAVMRSLRSKVDAVMIGAGTLRAEKISLALDDEERDQPLGVIVSSDAGKLSLDHLVSLGKQRILILAAEDTGGSTHGRAEILPVPTSDAGGIDLRAALITLKREKSVETLLVEGGPSLNASLFSLGLVDELFLTVAPKLLGGSPSITIVEGNVEENTAGPSQRDLGLVSVFAAGNELFLRYAAKRA